MIRFQLPNPNTSKTSEPIDINNCVIHATSSKKYNYPKHTTPYLLVANFQNSGSYILNDRAISTNEKWFYFLNAGDNLQIDFRNNLPIETLLIMFNSNFISDIAKYRASNIEYLLENSNQPSEMDFHAPAIPFFYNEAIQDSLIKIRANASEVWNLDSHLFDLISNFLDLQPVALKQIEKIKAKRTSTKGELYKRITLGRSYMEDNAFVPLTIEQIAQEACLNKFHFLKIFKDMYGVTPHQYIMNKRLEQSVVLLKSGNFSISEICHLIGFESLGTFTNLFKSRYGLTPSKFFS
ncbi:MAG TPA: helix-turn-helix transcriptional regulator [Mucilaginibacter sp.]|jgi:AraC-like DNA-binding protein|nr:helix-turn-helix transcriptional regulator [Mucilaginibacter sp.]